MAKKELEATRRQGAHAIKNCDAQSLCGK